MKNKFILFLGFFLLVLSAAFPQKTKKAQKSEGYQEIIILHVNDMHAKIDNMAKLAYLADSLRKTHPFVFLVSAGDNFTGNPVVDKYPDNGYPMIDLMNRCGFNASAIGNHDFDLGLEIFKRRIEQATFPFIACNINTKVIDFPSPDPFIILDAGRTKLAILGISQTGESGLPDTPSSQVSGLDFINGIESATRFSWLKEKSNNLIVLSHLGVDEDIHLAEKMPFIDIIIGGHSHTLTDSPMEKGNTMIVQAGSGLRNVGKITVMAKNGDILRKKAEMIELENITGEDTIVRKWIDQYIDQYKENAELTRIVGEARTPLVGFNELGSFISDALRNSMNADFAFQNRGGIRLDRLQEGEISVRDIYRLDPFENSVIMLQMTGNQIRSLICNAYNRDQTIDLAVSGMKYTIILDSYNQCQDVEMILDPTQTEPDPEKLYSVAMNSYMAAAYRFDYSGIIDSNNSLTTEEALIDYLQKVQTIDYQGIVRTYLKMPKYKKKK